MKKSKLSIIILLILIIVPLRTVRIGACMQIYSKFGSGEVSSLNETLLSIIELEKSKDNCNGAGRQVIQSFRSLMTEYNFYKSGPRNFEYRTNNNVKHSEFIANLGKASREWKSSNGAQMYRYPDGVVVNVHGSKHHGGAATVELYQGQTLYKLRFNHIYRYVSVDTPM